MANGIADLYHRHALAFDAARRRAFPERGWIERFARTVPKGGHILDLGCGGGEPIARYLVDRGYQVTGVDIAPAMINLARTRFARHHWVQADMRTYAPQPATYDGIVAWSSLFHLEHDDQAQVIRRMAMWMKASAVALFNTGADRGVSMGEFAGEALYHASLSPAEYRSIFARCGLVEVAHRAEDPDCGGATVWLVGRA